MKRMTGINPRRQVWIGQRTVPETGERIDLFHPEEDLGGRWTRNTDTRLSDRKQAQDWLDRLDD